tara:strand:- start:562 stop:1242 length:681 start_codon:yes stop_codon:yes gene_type:complete
MEKTNIYQKLLTIQEHIKGLSKDKKSHNYGYVTGNKLLSFIKPLMDEQKLILKQEILSIENTRQDYIVTAKKWIKDEEEEGKNIQIEFEKTKNEILSKVMMRFTWIDCETGEKDENLFGANGQNDWEKGLGSALTYGERYFLLKFFHIPTDKDDIDSSDRKQEAAAPSEKTKALTALEISVIENDIKKAKDIKALTVLYNSDLRIRTNKDLSAIFTEKRLEIQESK